jgi:hypothetical protein
MSWHSVSKHALLLHHDQSTPLLVVLLGDQDRVIWVRQQQNRKWVASKSRTKHAGNCRPAGLYSLAQYVWPPCVTCPNARLGLLIKKVD